ncbi:hypothetical protein ACXZ9C_11790 [Streptococcus agalactiae]
MACVASCVALAQRWSRGVACVACVASRGWRRGLAWRGVASQWRRGVAGDVGVVVASSWLAFGVASLVAQSLRRNRRVASTSQSLV